ncbi:hypothetical protein A9267_19510 [Shewanella sp. UCD-FRSSP16_17]|uniref:hypothetical protein n=1 Tax=unclassified Shewanella TaxID=196818 RepID=UPI0007EEB0E1|nr:MULTISPECIES: hypothetical protein [unclassified Shewanella]MBQ4892210.1 hypothetical protein [Shewanella sp. MMG014]OBT03782.1 hypothetical protein A9267_19510 [Shewanella sp. UCD-FRSSP16_17]
MIPFNISRLHTEVGIVQLNGHWVPNPDYEQKTALHINRLSQLSTDGWVELDINHNGNIKFIQQLQPFVVQHLVAQQQC